MGNLVRRYGKFEYFIRIESFVKVSCSKTEAVGSNGTTHCLNASDFVFHISEIASRLYYTAFRIYYKEINFVSIKN